MRAPEQSETIPSRPIISSPRLPTNHFGSKRQRFSTPILQLEEEMADPIWGRPLTQRIPKCLASCFESLNQLRHDLMEIANNTKISNTKYRSVWVLVDRDDRA